MLEALPDQAAVIDRNGTIIRTNKVWREFAAANGATAEHTDVGVNYLTVCSAPTSTEETADIHQRLRALMAGAIEDLSYEYPCHSPHELRWFLMRARRLREGGALITHTDITQRKLAELRADRQAKLDPLTLVLNRRGLAERLAAEVARGRRHGGAIAAILIDVDNFKEINSRVGHAAGDIVLVEMARRFCELLRTEDVLARIGGDEFLVLLPLTREKEAMRVAERLRLAVASAPIASAQDGELTVTCSAAVTELGEDCDDLEHILRSCRVGLASSKSRGKNRTTGAPSRKRAPTELRPGVVRQPIVRISDGALVGYELLACGPDELSPTGELFRHAAERGLLLKMDLACLHAGLARLHELPEGLMIHVNLYPATLLATDVAVLLAHVEPHHLTRLCLELNEQELVADPTYLRAKVVALRAAGPRLTIEGVGFGRSYLENLVVLEPSIIKLDRRLTHGVAHDADRARQLTRILRLADALEVNLVAEGLELEEDAARCRELGVELGQGELWGRPQSF